LVLARVTANLSGVNFVGAMYKAKLNSKLNVYSSLNYAFREHLTSQNTRNIATVAYNLGFDLAVVDVVGEQSVNLKFPGKLTVSAGIGESRKWLMVGGK
jgi:hypothetical protein